MNIAYQLSFWIPFVLENLFVLVLVYYYFYKKDVFEANLNSFFKAILGLFILYWLGQIVLLYISLMTSGFGKYLTSGWNNFFLQRTLDISISFVITLLLAIVGLIFINLVIRKQQRPYLDAMDAKVFFITILVVGWVNFFPLLILAFILAIVIQIIYMVRLKQNVPFVTMTVFVLLSCLIISLFSQFDFYKQILHLLALV